MSIRPYPATIRPSIYFRFRKHLNCASHAFYSTYGCIAWTLLRNSEKYPAILFRRSSASLSHYPAKSGQNPAKLFTSLLRAAFRRKQLFANDLQNRFATEDLFIDIYPATHQGRANVRKCPQFALNQALRNHENPGEIAVSEPPMAGLMPGPVRNWLVRKCPQIQSETRG